MNMDTDVVSRAAIYAKRCYSQNVTVEQCNLFYTRAIKFEERGNAKCPFVGDVCLGGKDSAYSASTGFTDANFLGINVAEPLYFRRSLVCSPMAVDDCFIRYRQDELNDTVVDYVGSKPS